MGEFISVKIDLGKAELALRRAQETYNSVLFLAGSMGGRMGAEGRAARQARGTEGPPDEDAAEERSSPDRPRREAPDGPSAWRKAEQRFARFQAAVSGAIDSPVNTAINAVGLVPGAGPFLSSAARGAMAVGTAYADYGAPLVKGIVTAMLKSQGVKDDIIDGVLRSIAAGAGAVANPINKLRNWDEAFRPTWEAMKEITKLRSLAGGPIDASKMGKMYDFLFDYNMAETGMRRKMQHIGTDRLAESISESVMRSMSH